MTIKDIAERCGVSVSTVSRVLNDHPDVSAANRARVLEVVRALHYVPNNSARDLVRPQSDAIGLVVRGVGNPFFTGVIHAVEDAIGRAGYTMVLHQIRSGEDEVRSGAELARSRRLQGLILLGGCFDYTPEQVALLDVPFVCCSYTNSFGELRPESYSSVTIDDRLEAYRAVRLLLERGHRRIGVLLDSTRYTNSFGELRPESYSSVTIDDRLEAYRAVRLLLERGHRRIGVLLDSTRNRSISQLRYMGYCRALEEAGIPPEESLVEETETFDMAAAYRGMTRLLERRGDLTAVFVIADSMAVAAMKAAYDAGRRVPEDCSVVAIDGIDISAYCVPTLTTLVQPQLEMGLEAVEILVDMIEGRVGNRHVVLDTALRAGGSVREV